MFRNFDWECIGCSLVSDHLVDVPSGTDAPDTIEGHCIVCEIVTTKVRRRVNLVAQYLADRPFSPLVQGGQFDTAGYSEVPPLPEFAGKTASDFMEHRSSSEFKEAKRERANKAKENKAKRKRAELIRQGATIDIRHNPLPGDPNIMQ